VECGLPSSEESGLPLASVGAKVDLVLLDDRRDDLREPLRLGPLVVKLILTVGIKM
jgi:hypothetical protein